LNELEIYVNSDLNDVLGNFIHRTLTFIMNYFQGNVPKRNKLDENDEDLIQAIKETPQNVSNLIEAFKFKAALKEIIGLARKGNNYLSIKEPWHQIKTDKIVTATTLNLCIQLVRSLAILLSPFIPNASQKIWDSLGIQGDITQIQWDEASKLLISSGHTIPKPKPLFSKVTAKKLAKKLESIRQEKKSEAIKEPQILNLVTFDEFNKLDIRTAKIKSVKKVPNTKNLLVLSIRIGEKEQKRWMKYLNLTYPDMIRWHYWNTTKTITFSILTPISRMIS